MKKRMGKEFKKSHLILSKYVPLKCACCGKDIFKAMSEEPYCGAIEGIVIKRDDNDPKKHYIKDIYWACKGDCDKKLQSQYPDDLSPVWEDIGDLINPLVYLQWFIGIINNLKEGRYIYTKEAFRKEKHFMIALSQKVFREMTAKERRRAVELKKLEPF